MPRLPQVSGPELARLLEQLGYMFIRQRGSHARYSFTTRMGTHHVTVPMHPVIAKGTLNDILDIGELVDGYFQKRVDQPFIDDA